MLGKLPGGPHLEIFETTFFGKLSGAEILVTLGHV